MGTQAYAPNGSRIVGVNFTGWWRTVDGTFDDEARGYDLAGFDHDNIEFTTIFCDEDGLDWPRDQLILAPEWTGEDYAACEGEGWFLEADENTIVADSDYDTFKVDEEDGWSDEAAVAFVRQKASEGSQRHRKALQLHRLAKGIDDDVTVLTVSHGDQWSRSTVTWGTFRSLFGVDADDVSRQIFRQGFARIGGGGPMVEVYI